MSRHNDHNGLMYFRQLGEDSQQALDAIMRQYKKPLIFYIRRFVGDDESVKEVFLDTMHAVWVQRREIAYKRNPVAWMIRIAHNKAINRIRDEKRPYMVPLEDLPFPDHPLGNGELAMEVKELDRLLQEAAARLSPQERMIFQLSKTEGLTRKEIAARCNVSEHTVKNQLSRSIKKVNRFLAELLGATLL